MAMVFSWLFIPFFIFTNTRLVRSPLDKETWKNNEFDMDKTQPVNDDEVPSQHLDILCF